MADIPLHNNSFNDSVKRKLADDEITECENISSLTTVDEWKRHAKGPFNNPFDLDESKFVELFGLHKNLVQNLINELNKHIPLPQRTKAIPTDLKVLVTLRFLISGDFQRGLGNDSLFSLSQTSISRCVLVVCQAISNSLFQHWIKFPQSDEDRALISNRFEELCSVPNILGSMIFWHPPVNSPKLNAKIKKLVKEIPSKAVQIVCDGDFRILDIYVGECKSGDAQKIWMETEIYKIMKQRFEEGFKKEWIVVSSDASYDKEPWLIKPKEKNVLEIDLGIAQTAGTQCLENFKSKFGCLKSRKILCYSSKQISNIIHSCAILYNIIIHYENDM